MEIYPLVMTNIAMERSTIFKNGKPSISMGHLYHGYVSHNQMVIFMGISCCIEVGEFFITFDNYNIYCWPPCRELSWDFTNEFNRWESNGILKNQRCGVETLTVEWCNL